MNAQQAYDTLDFILKKKCVATGEENDAAKLALSTLASAITEMAAKLKAIEDEKLAEAAQEAAPPRGKKGKLAAVPAPAAAEPEPPPQE